MKKIVVILLLLVSFACAAQTLTDKQQAAYDQGVTLIDANSNALKGVLGLVIIAQQDANQQMTNVGARVTALELQQPKVRDLTVDGSVVGTISLSFQTPGSAYCRVYYGKISHPSSRSYSNTVKDIAESATHSIPILRNSTYPSGTKIYYWVECLQDGPIISTLEQAAVMP